MSHFTVLVITETQPSEDDLQRILLPWHEYECTGLENEYVVDVDETEEALAAYAAATVTRLRGPDGTLHNQFTEAGQWKPEFSQPDPKYLPRRIGFIPPGYEEVELPASDFESAAEWIKDYYGRGIVGQSPGEEVKYGYIQLDANGNVIKVVNRTNPNRKWDWWVVGGRWSGLLLLKDGETADQAPLGIVDIDQMRANKRAEAEQLWDEVHSVVGDLPPFDSFETLRERGGSIDAARDFYWAQPAIAALKTHFKESWSLEKETTAALMTREAFVQQAEDGALVTFAIVKDGKWYERGKMGWWACVSDEKDKDEWNTEFAKLLDDLPPTTWLTVVDCHI